MATAAGCKADLDFARPTARAYSHYSFATSQGWEPYSFQAALAAEPRRLALPQPNFSLANRAYRTLGHYAQQLKSFCELIPPARHLFLLYTDFVAAPDARWRESVTSSKLTPPTPSTPSLQRKCYLSPL